MPDPCRNRPSSTKGARDAPKTPCLCLSRPCRLVLPPSLLPSSDPSLSLSVPLLTPEDEICQTSNLHKRLSTTRSKLRSAQDGLLALLSQPRAPLSPPEPSSSSAGSPSLADGVRAPNGIAQILEFHAPNVSDKTRETRGKISKRGALSTATRLSRSAPTTPTSRKPPTPAKLLGHKHRTASSTPPRPLLPQPPPHTCTPNTGKPISGMPKGEP